MKTITFFNVRENKMKFNNIKIESINTNVFTILLLFCSLSANSIFPLESISFEDALWSQVQALSLADYKKSLKEEVKDHKNWRKTIQTVFQKLKSNSGNANFEIQFAIIKDSSFNAFAFPGGQFIIHAGLLDELDRMIVKDTSSKPESTEFIKFREAYFAPVVGHELGHYYNRHSFKSYLAKIENKKSDDENEESRNLELDADVSGILLLQKSGYDINYFTKILKYLNELRQKELTAGSKVIPYLQSHPSPHERLSHINTEHKDLHTWAAKMEYVFADIQTSRKLDQAVKELDDALNTYPDNLDFQKAKAVALHKIWLESALLEDLKLKSIVDLPSFRDNMVFDKKAQKSLTKKIPGDRAKFNKALTAYRNLMKENKEPWFVSNFAVLLVYSPEKQDEANAIKLAKSAFKADQSIQTLNNLALCHSIAISEGNAKLSREIFREMARNLEGDVEDFFKGQTRDSEAISLVRDLKKALKSKEAQDEDISTVILNLALNEISFTKGITNVYFTQYDSESKWAEYLSKLTSLPFPEKEQGKPTVIDGIHLGTSIKELLAAWKTPDRKPKVEDGFEIWYYDQKSAKVSMRDGFIQQILLYGEDSPPLGDIKVGSEKFLVEQTLGKKYKKQNRYFIFEQKEKIGLSFDEDKVERVIVFE